MPSMDPHKWWQKAVFYQIYPRSFYDADGDGIGDLAGIRQKLDYLQSLGVDALWLSPHYPSPQFDCGYDVADYTSVAPEYGDLDDFWAFLDQAHQRGMRVILDLVLNHTSEAHPWFVESRSSKSNPYRDWYVWHPGKNGAPPNNWQSIFGGPAWELDSATGEYYYHFFFKQQPDLNWHNPRVKEALFSAARFWLEGGVDGFRLDAISTIYEHNDMQDHTADIDQGELFHSLRGLEPAEYPEGLLTQRRLMFENQVEQPLVHVLMKELRSLVDEYPDRVLVGETEQIAYYGDGQDELHLVFNFPLMRTRRLSPAWIRRNQRERLQAMPAGAWPCNTLGNHDTTRVLTRFADGQHDEALARLSLALMLTLKGTPFLYNGEEIGMADLILTELGQFRDNLGVWFFEMETLARGTPPSEAILAAALFSRDRCRTPMQWANAPNAGFSPPHTATWLPVNPNYRRGINVADQRGDQASLLNFYRRLLKVRKNSFALQVGDMTMLDPENEAVLSFVRSAGDSAVVVAMNMTPSRAEFSIEMDGELEAIFTSAQTPPSAETPGSVALDPFEIYLAALHSPQQAQ